MRKIRSPIIFATPDFNVLCDKTRTINPDGAATQVGPFPHRFRTLARRFFNLNLNLCFIYLMVKKVGRVSISYSIKQSLSFQVLHDYVNTHWYFTSKARVASQRHLSINLDLLNPTVYIVHTIISSMNSSYAP